MKQTLLRIENLFLKSVQYNKGSIKKNHIKRLDMSQFRLRQWVWVIVSLINVLQRITLWRGTCTHKLSSAESSGTSRQIVRKINFRISSKALVKRRKVAAGQTDCWRHRLWQTSSLPTPDIFFFVETCDGDVSTTNLRLFECRKWKGLVYLKTYSDI